MTEERAFELLQDLNGMTREEAIEVLELHLIEFKHDFGWNRTTIKAMEMAVEALEEPERKTGHWIIDGEGMLHCSACAEIPVNRIRDTFKVVYDIHPLKMNYCPNCGVRMVGEQ